MKKYAILLIAIALLLPGCPGSGSAAGNNTTIAAHVDVSSVTVTEEKETLITGDSSILIINNTNITNSTNHSIPDYTFSPNQTLYVFFINVSYIPDWTAGAGNEHQGEAILLKKGDADILIDAGPAQNADYLINFLREKGVDDLELLVSTHARPENYGAMGKLLDNIPVEQFMWSGNDGDDAQYAALVQKAENLSKKTVSSAYLSNLSINGINLMVINPHDGASRLGSIDNNGLAFKISDRNFCLMTTSDIAYGAQTSIANSAQFSPKCAILQIPNYGLGAASSEIGSFLSKVAPKTAIITGSSFDPANERYSIYEQLRLANITIYKNFENGTATNVLRITADGYNYSISSQ